MVLGRILRQIFTWGNKRPRRLCYAVGLYTIGYQMFDMGYATATHNTRDAHDLKKRYGAGSWVVISGAADPVGQAFAKALGSKGFNVLLVDGSNQGLENTKEMLRTAGMQTEVKELLFDYENSDEWTLYEQLCNKISEEVGGKENISILVNNVEERDPFGEKFHKASDKQLVQTINMNSFPLVFMTRFLGPNLKERMVGGRSHSAIINMTSMHADWPVQSLPIYSATKSFSDVFSQNLWYENQEMDILTVKHMPTKSLLNPLGVSAEDTVDGVLKDLGHERISYGHANHSLLRYWLLFQQSPWWFNTNTLLGKLSGL